MKHSSGKSRAALFFAGTFLWVWPGAAFSQIYTVNRTSVTQGLERHGPDGATSSYDLVVGKDTLVEMVVQPRTAAPLTPSICAMRYPAGLRTYNAQLTPLPGGLVAARCWLPGGDLHREGSYAFSIGLGGPAPQITTFTVRNFRPSGVLRLMVLPLVRPEGHFQYQAWSNAFVLNVVESLAETNRRFPMATGIGNFGFETRGTGSLRFDLLPPSQCVPMAGEGLEPARIRCDGRQLSTMDFMMRFYNGSVGRRYPDADLYDLGWLAVPMQATNGGLACQGAQRVIGSGLDPNPTGGSATTIAHEIAHCMGEVTAASPNLNADRVHARNWTMTLPTGEALVDMRLRQAVPAPIALMHPSVANVFNTYFEAFEYNSVRRGLVARTGLLASHERPGAVRLAALPGALPMLALQGGAQDLPLYGLLATVRADGAMTVDYAGSLGMLSGNVVTPSAPDGPYFIDFLDRSGTLLASHGFAPNFEFPDRRLEVTGVSVMTPFPTGTSRVRLRRGKARLQDFQCDGNAAALGAPVFAREREKARVKWSARHSGGRPLFHIVSFASGQGQMPKLLEVGRMAGEWQTDASFLPATANGRFTVTASDGCNVSSAGSGPVTLPRRAPIARVRMSPDGPAGRVAVAVGWDPTDGVLTGESLQWRLDGKKAGPGHVLKVPGRRSKVELVATNRAGMQTVATAAD
ncbi:MAG TPA: hypothetical protein VK403_05840 [Allosphingosinicella sp.]|nr:hypothetical protein [Allosphingosinicella sp.]